MKRALNTGLIGLGRLGKEYARILQLNPNFHLSATCSIIPSERTWSEKQLGIPSFETVESLLRSQEVDVIIIASSTDMHVHHIQLCLEAGKHVFCEKPLSVNIAECKQIIEFKNDYPDLSVMVGFVRRFDESYRYAKRKIEEGIIGIPFLVRSQTVDLDEVDSFQIKYVKSSGGIFHDYNIHDVDIARWFLDSKIIHVHAMGGSFKYPEFQKSGDAESVISTCQLENGTMVVLGASRIAAHGHDTYTEISGTEGTLRIGRPSSKNRVEIFDQYGIRKESVKDFWERFEDAFVNQLNHFNQCILENVQIDLDLKNAYENTKVTTALTKSFQTGKVEYV